MFEEAKKLVEEAKDIYLVAHINPDGDAIGSEFGLAIALNKIGKNAKVIMPTCSDSFKFLPYILDAVENVKEDNYDLLICLDSSDKERLAIKTEDYNKAKKVLMIDHHVKKDVYGDVACIDNNLPAASELVYNFINYLGVEIDKDIATFLYTGIVTDTGSFNYSSTKSSTLIVASNLIETGINFSDICKKLNDTIKEEKLRLISKTIDNMEVYFEGKLRYSFVDYDTILSLGLDEEDAEGMTNYLRMVENTEVAVYVRGKSDGTNKVSMRSGGNIDVSKIAMDFGGGGHMRASGYTMGKNYKSSKKELLKKIGEMIQ
ncbi:MAG: bifunctional oligoribonuclease/PAP phosphatase NrnA [Clostridia bacterium]